MKYLCLMIQDDRKYEALSSSEAQDLDEAAIEFADELHHNGHMVTGSALGTAQSATTVRVRNGDASVTDGPYAETNEQVGGFLVIEARDLNEAIALISKMPSAYLGGIEIRPLREIVSRTSSGKRHWQA